VTLDPMPDAATLLRMKAEREGRSRRATFVTQILGGYPPTFTVTDTTTLTALVLPPQTITRSISLRIPWSALVSDNAKYGVVNGKLIAQKPYRAAKKAIASLAQDAMAGRPPAECPLALHARVWMPDNRRHDLTNSCKIVHDALEGTIYTDDVWLHRVTWERAGVDVDAPRCELTISPLP
jgi:Holliday junction resolvase RusA-like endonuclease